MTKPILPPRGRTVQFNPRYDKRDFNQFAVGIGLKRPPRFRRANALSAWWDDLSTRTVMGAVYGQRRGFARRAHPFPPFGLAAGEQGGACLLCSAHLTDLLMGLIPQGVVLSPSAAA